MGGKQKSDSDNAEEMYPNLLQPHRIKQLMVSGRGGGESRKQVGERLLPAFKKSATPRQGAHGGLTFRACPLGARAQGIKIMFVAAGPAAVHCMVGDAAGRLYTWGRNEVRNCLGHGGTRRAPAGELSLHLENMHVCMPCRRGRAALRRRY